MMPFIILKIIVSFQGYVVQGSNGEYVYLSNKERVDMIEFVRKEVPKDKLVIAGSGCEGKFGVSHAFYQ